MRVLQIFAVLVAAVLAVPIDALSQEQIGSTQQPLTVSVGTTWPTPYIVVCWESSTSPLQQQWVREAVERTWMHQTRLVFAHWGACSANMQGIHISIENGPFPAGLDAGNSQFGWPRADIGRPANGISRMYFTFDFVARSSDFSGCTTVGSAANRQCIESIAVHEFGHAIGLMHEQDRGDTPVTCVSRLGQDYAGSGLSTNIQLGPFDDTSIMAYCNPAWNNNGNLSPNDIFYAQRLYGRKAAGSIVSFDGRCLDTAGGTTNTTPIQTWDCLGGTQFAPGEVASPHQRWFYVPTSSFTLANTKRVLDVPRNDASTGNRLQLFDYLGAPGQRWSMPRARLRSMGGMCLRPVQLPARPGTELGLFRCDPRVSGPDVNFELRGDGSLVHEASGLCADVSNFGGAGTRVVLWSCNKFDNQKFQLAGHNSITGYRGLCLDIGMPQNNLDKFFGVDGINRLQVWQCNGQLNQKFSFAGDIVGIANKCVDVRAFGRWNGTPVQLWDCNGMENQYFEVLW